MSLTTVVGAIQQRPIEQLKMYPQNSRTHSTAQIQQIAASIREFGFVNPILIVGRPPVNWRWPKSRSSYWNIFRKRNAAP
jgi:hypothetical protein